MIKLNKEEPIMNENKTKYLSVFQQVTHNIAIAGLVLMAIPAYGESEKTASTRSILR